MTISSASEIEAVIDSAMWYLFQGKYGLAKRRLYIALMTDGANTWKSRHLANRTVGLWADWVRQMEDSMEGDLYEIYGEHKIVAATDRAIAIEEDDGLLRWLPRSVVLDGDSIDVGDTHDLEVKRWFLKRANLV